MRDVMIKVKSLKESGILIKGVTQTIENETEERRGGFFSILLGTPGANVFRNKLAGKEWSELDRMFEIQKYCHSKPLFKRCLFME